MAPHHAQVEELVDNATVDLEFKEKTEEELENTMQFEEIGVFAYDSLEDQMYSF